MDCPSEEQFYDWLLDGDGVLPSDVRDHVAACPKCSGTVEAFTFLAKSLSGLRQKVVEEDSPLPPLPAAASVSDEPKRIGNYLILERLGEGGMGVVYKAFDLPCARMVALKLVRPAHCTDPAYQKRFLAECRVAAQLSHPHIVRVLDQDSVDGRLFCAMEYVKGTSLDRALAKEGLLPAATATRIALQIAAGLGEAHRQRVVHRDVKPANVLLEDNLERVRITDFGVMKDLNRETSDTLPGALVGTLNFMAPEQIEGQAVSPATDVFATGVILYQMLTGKLPFNDATPTAVMRKVVAEPHRGLHEFGDLVPPPLREIVDRCLAKDPARRYQSGGELAEALGRCQETPPAQGASKTLAWRTGWWFVVAGLVLITALAGGKMAWRWATAPNAARALSAGRAWTVPGLEMEFVYVAPGSFRMGSSEGLEPEKPEHNVQITHGYWMGKYEVTQAEYEAVVGQNPSQFKGGRNPVEDLPWADAVAFCAKLCERERAAGRLPAGHEYRLPTEAEWEYAAGLGQTFTYCGSSVADEVAWYFENSGVQRLSDSQWPLCDKDPKAFGALLAGNGCQPHPVGLKKPNAAGLYDMSGNVWEWCLDWYDPSFYRGSPSADPANLQETGRRVMRGGSWYCCASILRPSNRGFKEPGFHDGGVGLRVCLAPRSGDRKL